MTSDKQRVHRVAGATPRRGSRRMRPVRFSLGPQEFIKTGLSLFDPHDPYYFAVSLSWTRFFLLFLAAELAINTLFALLYTLQPAAIANQQTPGFVSAFFFSLETLATVGYGEMYPGTLYGHIVSTAEILTGVIFMAIMTGLLFVRFSKPKAKILYAEHPVITALNGKPTLMLRLGNARLSPMHGAEAALYTLARSVSEEGQRHVAIVELPLVRSKNPVFAIMWTIMHVIDEDSPLFPLTTDMHAAQGMRLFLNVSARDPAIGQNVSDIRTYAGADIRVGMRYVDAVESLDENRVVADYALLGAIEPDTIQQPRPAERAVQVDA